MITPTSVYEKNLKAYLIGKTMIINEGGGSSSKTWSILQLIITIAAQSEKHLLISIVSETLPHLKRGAERQFFLILDELKLYKVKDHNKTDHIYKLNKSTIEFFATDNEDRVKGFERDILYCNEVDKIKWAAFSELIRKTNICNFVDYNPSKSFYIHTEILQGQLFESSKFAYIHSTYLDNINNLSEVVIEGFEQKRKLALSGKSKYWENWWKVYGLGQVGALEGLIFTNWDTVDEFIDNPDQIVWGIDYGFVNDPTAIIKIGFNGQDIYLEEKVYQPISDFHKLISLIENAGVKKNELIITDNTQELVRTELIRKSYMARNTIKGKDSINYGISVMNGFNFKIVKESTNLINEFRNYAYELDEFGKATNIPIDLYNHGIDAVRYGVTWVKGKRQVKVY